MCRLLASAIMAIALASPAPAARAQDSANAGARATYGNELRRALLSSGVSVQVMWPERYTPGPVSEPYPKGYPRLIVFGPMDDATMFQILTAGQVLDRAKAAGFVMVQMATIGHGSRWYDLAKGIPACDVNKRLCL